MRTKLPHEVTQAFDQLDHAAEVLKFDQFEVVVNGGDGFTMHCIMCGKATGWHDFNWVTLAELIDDAAIHLAYYCGEAKNHILDDFKEDLDNG